MPMLINPDGILQTLPGCGAIKFCGEAILTCQKTSEDWLVDYLNNVYFNDHETAGDILFPSYPVTTDANGDTDMVLKFSPAILTHCFYFLPILTDGTKNCIQITSKFDFKMLVGAVSPLKTTVTGTARLFLEQRAGGFAKEKGPRILDYLELATAKKDVHVLEDHDVVSQHIDMSCIAKSSLDIMEKEGVNVADRPRSVAVHETLSEGFRVILEGDTERWHRMRRVLHANLQPKAAETYEPMQTSYSASLTLSVTYGKITPTSYTDPAVVDIQRFSARLGRAVRPGEYLVDAYPILRFVPGYLSQLKAWNREEMVFYQEHLDEVRRQMICSLTAVKREGTARPSFARFMLENQKQYQIEDRELAFLAGVIFGAGTDATTSAMTIMMMAAATHTDAQARVQEELDDVVGHMRHSSLLVPTFADQEMLLQVTAFILKSLRWRPVSFGGFPHRTSKDIIWKNYLIPAGATVIGNHWAIANDPEVFPDPYRFNPQCWIDDTGRVRDDLRFFTFGFGCRFRQALCDPEPVNFTGTITR
ncbi:cytochrome P450 [Suillus fuscotomentosus]|uniref:Cytochrome P450 n=1 Tax=Suillus fuscotomentosus TaxID=1912939 RepID=A0AAD4HEG6_9AGAM|nr:cytochrome P450 [Suillus fuscotomentosus]KAG1893623.1 cytochrome P450 [Suillus fuscotomentosus]